VDTSIKYTGKEEQHISKLMIFLLRKPLNEVTGKPYYTPSQARGILPKVDGKIVFPGINMDAIEEHIVARAETDSNGVAILNNIQPGVYYIVAYAFEDKHGNVIGEMGVLESDISYSDIPYYHVWNLKIEVGEVSKENNVDTVLLTQNNQYNER
jgi:hypothetical protein